MRACENCPNRLQNMPDDVELVNGEALVALRDDGSIVYLSLITETKRRRLLRDNLSVSVDRGYISANSLTENHPELVESIERCESPDAERCNGLNEVMDPLSAQSVNSYFHFE